jgi:hypothetical protein
MARFVIARRVADEEPARVRLTTFSKLRRQVASFANVVDTSNEPEEEESEETLFNEGGR